MWWVWIGRDGLIGRFQGVERIAISWLEIWPALGLLAQCQYSHNVYYVKSGAMSDMFIRHVGH